MTTYDYLINADLYLRDALYEHPEHKGLQDVQNSVRDTVKMIRRNSAHPKLGAKILSLSESIRTLYNDITLHPNIVAKVQECEENIASAWVMQGSENF